MPYNKKIAGLIESPHPLLGQVEDESMLFSTKYALTFFQIIFRVVMSRISNPTQSRFSLCRMDGDVAEIVNKVFKYTHIPTVIWWFHILICLLCNPT